MSKERFIQQTTVLIRNKTMRKKEFTPEEKRDIETNVEKLSDIILNQSEDLTAGDWKALYIGLSCVISDIEEIIEETRELKIARGNEGKTWKEKQLQELKRLRDDALEKRMQSSSSSIPEEEWTEFKKKKGKDIKVDKMARVISDNVARATEHIGKNKKYAYGEMRDKTMRAFQTSDETKESNMSAEAETQTLINISFGEDRRQVAGRDGAMELFAELGQFVNGQINGREDSPDERILFKNLEGLTSENTTFEEFKEMYQNVEKAKKLIETNGADGKLKETLKTMLESLGRRLKEVWITQYVNRTEEIVKYTEPKLKSVADVLLEIERRIKVVSWGNMRSETAQRIVDQIVADTTGVLKREELQDKDLKRLAEIYDSEYGLNSTEQTEYLQMALGFMSQIIGEEQDKRRKKDEWDKEEQQEKEKERVNNEVEEVINQINTAIEDGIQGNKINNAVTVTIKTETLLGSGKLTEKQIERLVTKYAEAKGKLEKLNKNERKKVGANVIIEKAEELLQRKEAGEKIEFNPEQAVKVIEKERKSLEDEIRRKQKSREEIERILKKHKSKIKKFLSARKTVLKISAKYGDRINTYEELSSSIKNIEKELLEAKAEMNSLNEKRFLESRAENAVRVKKIQQCSGKILKLQKRKNEIRKDIKSYNKAFKQMKDIRTEIAEEVSSSKEWSKTTKDYIKENCETNQMFYEVVEKGKVKEDFKVSAGEREQLRIKSAQIKWLEHGLEGNGSQSTEWRTRTNKKGEVSNTQGRTGQETGKIRNISPYPKNRQADKKRHRTKREEVDFETDPDKEIEFKELSYFEKIREAFEFYRNNAKFKWWGSTAFAFMRAWTNRGRMEWKRQFLKKEEVEILPDAAANFRKGCKDEFEKRRGTIALTMSSNPEQGKNGKIPNEGFYQDLL